MWLKNSMKPSDSVKLRSACCSCGCFRRHSQKNGHSLNHLSNNKYNCHTKQCKMKDIEEQLGNFSKKYVWTCKTGQSKRQAAMQTVNKLDSLSSHLINQTTTRIRHKWSMNLRMDWECLSVFKKPDRSPAGHCSLSWFSPVCFCREPICPCCTLYSYRSVKALLLTQSLCSHLFFS